MTTRVLVIGLDGATFEVIDPLNELRLVCDADDHGIGFDLR